MAKSNRRKTAPSFRWARVPLDTLTTRFLVLFVLVLLIPGISLVGFSASQLAGQLKAQLQQERRQVLSEAKALLSSREQQLRAFSQLPVSAGYWQVVDKAALAIDSRLPANKMGIVYSDAQTVPSLAMLAADNKVLTLSLQAIFPFGSYYQSTGLIAAWIGNEQEETATPGFYTLTPQLQALPKGLKASMQNAVAQWENGSNDLNSEQITEIKDWAIWHWPWLNEENQWLGSVVFAYPTQGLQNQWMGFYAGVYILFLLSFLFACGMAIWASRNMTVPLRKLVTELDELSLSVTEWAGQGKALPHLQQSNPIFELRELSIAFHRLLAAIQDDVKWREEFVATLTHDLKVPLLGTHQTFNYLEKGAYGKLPEYLEPVLKPLRQANQFCLDLIGTLLDLYSHEAGKQKLLLQQHRLLPLLEESVTDAQPLAEEKAITLKMEPPPSTEDARQTLEVRVDSLALKRVLHNLLANAISHTPKQGEVFCWALTEDDWPTDTVTHVTGFEHTTLRQPVVLADRVLIIIQDSGLGMEASTLGQLFQRFGTLQQSRSPMNVGLGLYHSHKVIAAHGGILWIETTEGQGTAVVMALPRHYLNPEEHPLYYDRRQARR